MMSLLRRFVPRPVFDLYHRALSWLAAVYYGNPSQKMIVIGVTGTNGKTTTSYLIAKALEASGKKAGCTTTAIFKIGDKEWLNDKKMTMLGRFALQKMLRQMVDAGCAYAVVETSSQGIVQHRHENIAYDVAVFTNLTPEHIEAHGSFENYKRAKIELFHHVARRAPKTINGSPIRKVIVLNTWSEHAKDFAVSGVDEVVWVPEEISLQLQIPGRVNVQNASQALAVAEVLGVPRERAKTALEQVKGIPGRFERIDAGQPFTVIVDYAPEPYALEACYATIAHIPHTRLIHVLGSAGGGRDMWRRKVLGEMAAKKAAVVIVTNEDPYDEDPSDIIRQVEDGARSVGRMGVDIYAIQDRKEAIQFAMKSAKEGDLVLLTGKGCEQAIMGPNGSRTPWDERQVARDAIRGIMTSEHVSD